MKAKELFDSGEEPGIEIAVDPEGLGGNGPKLEKPDGMDGQILRVQRCRKKAQRCKKEKRNVAKADAKKLVESVMENTGTDRGAAAFFLYLSCEDAECYAVIHEGVWVQL